QGLDVGGQLVEHLRVAVERRLGVALLLQLLALRDAPGGGGHVHAGGPAGAPATRGLRDEHAGQHRHQHDAGDGGDAATGGGGAALRVEGRLALLDGPEHAGGPRRVVVLQGAVVVVVDV